MSSISKSAGSHIKLSILHGRLHLFTQANLLIALIVIVMLLAGLGTTTGIWAIIHRAKLPWVTEEWKVYDKKADHPDHHGCAKHKESSGTVYISNGSRKRKLVYMEIEDYQVCFQIGDIVLIESKGNTVGRSCVACNYPGLRKTVDGYKVTTLDNNR